MPLTAKFWKQKIAIYIQFTASSFGNCFIYSYYRNPANTLAKFSKMNEIWPQF